MASNKVPTGILGIQALFDSNLEESYRSQCLAEQWPTVSTNSVDYSQVSTGVLGILSVLTGDKDIEASYQVKCLEEMWPTVPSDRAVDQPSEDLVGQAQETADTAEVKTSG